MKRIVAPGKVAVAFVMAAIWASLLHAAPVVCDAPRAVSAVDSAGNSVGLGDDIATMPTPTLTSSATLPPYFNLSYSESYGMCPEVMYFGGQVTCFMDLWLANGSALDVPAGVANLVVTTMVGLRNEESHLVIQCDNVLFKLDTAPANRYFVNITMQRGATLRTPVQHTVQWSMLTYATVTATGAEYSDIIDCRPSCSFALVSAGICPARSVLMCPVAFDHTRGTACSMVFHDWAGYQVSFTSNPSPVNPRFPIHTTPPLNSSNILLHVEGDVTEVPTIHGNDVVVTDATQMNNALYSFRVSASHTQLLRVRVVLDVNKSSGVLDPRCVGGSMQIGQDKYVQVTINCTRDVPDGYIGAIPTGNATSCQCPRDTSPVTTNPTNVTYFGLCTLCSSRETNDLGNQPCFCKESFYNQTYFGESLCIEGVNAYDRDIQRLERSYEKSAAVCQECPFCAKCGHNVTRAEGASGETVTPILLPRRGFWQPRSHPNMLFMCHDCPEACPGNQVQHCAVGHTGPLCAVCEDGYGRISEHALCRPCIPKYLQWMLLLFSFALFVILVFFLTRSALKPRRVVTAIFKIVVNHLQLVYVLGMFNHRSSERIAEGQNFLGFISATHAVAPTCVGVKLDSVSMVYAAVAFAGLVFVMAVFRLVLFFSARRRLRRESMAPSADATEATRQVSSLSFSTTPRSTVNPFSDAPGHGTQESLLRGTMKLFPDLNKNENRQRSESALFAEGHSKEIDNEALTGWDFHTQLTAVLAYTLYPSLTGCALWMLSPCANYGSDHVMVSDKSVSCSSRQYHIGRGLAWAMVPVWVFGVPLSLMYALHHARRRKMRMWQHLRFVWSGYSDELWYWEGLISFRKAMLIAIAALFGNTPLIQNVIGCVALGGQTVMHFLATPYISYDLNNLEAVSLVSITVLSLVDVLFAIPNQEEGNYWLAIAAPLVLNAVFVLYAGYLLFRAVRRVILDGELPPALHKLQSRVRRRRKSRRQQDDTGVAMSEGTCETPDHTPSKSVQSNGGSALVFRGAGADAGADTPPLQLDTPRAFDPTLAPTSFVGLQPGAAEADARSRRGTVVVVAPPTPPKDNISPGSAPS